MEVYTSTVNLPGGWAAHTDREVDLDSYTPEQRSQFDVWLSNELVVKATKKRAREVHSDLAEQAVVGEPGGEHGEGSSAAQGLDQAQGAGADEGAGDGEGDTTTTRSGRGRRSG